MSGRLQMASGQLPGRNHIVSLRGLRMGDVSAPFRVERGCLSRTVTVKKAISKDAALPRQRRMEGEEISLYAAT